MQIGTDVLVKRFLDYVSYATQSDEENDQVWPSTPGQMVLAKHIAAELKGLGLTDVEVDEHAYIMATLPANGCVAAPTVGFIAHLDTALDAPGEWYLDRANGLLYVYPESADSTFSLSLTEKPLITFADAAHMTISGLTMLCTRTNALSGTGDDLTLDHLTIRNVGGYAVTLTGYRNRVRFCDILPCRKPLCARRNRPFPAYGDRLWRQRSHHRIQRHPRCGVPFQ